MDLLKRLEDAKLAGYRDKGAPDYPKGFTYTFRSNEQAASVALAALGLGDLDAAVDKIAHMLFPYTDQPGWPRFRQAVANALEATLCPE